MPGDRRQYVSNSFDYTPARVLDGFVLDPDRCSAVGLGLSGAATSRVVIVHRQGRFVLCRTRTASFDDAEIRSIVHGLGQLYLDVSGKLSMNDFAADLEQLVITGQCRRCGHLPACVACYAPREGSHFLEDEAWIAGWLGAMEGRVLDVGMGRAPYLDALLGSLSSGTVEYHGLDPDPSVAAGAWEGALVLHEGHIEDFAVDPGSFDHVVALRSLNHFIDVDAALRRICDCLKPGGTLLLVESVALPMVRTAGHAEASHRAGEGGFQHLRNWDSHRVLARVEGRLPLRVEHHRPIGRDTCDQWFLVMKRD